MSVNAVALYTTVYPGAERFLADWYRSVRAQTCRKFDLWIGVDELGIEAIAAVLGEEPRAKWVFGEPGDSPTMIRERAIARMVEEHEFVVFADCDDLNEPVRVEASLGALEICDVAGCAMRLIDESGARLDAVFKPQRPEDATRLLARRNVFGLGNTAYRCEVLRRCLPIPRDCRLLDWFLAACAFAAGARMSFDSRPLVSYRRHGASMTPLLTPFTAEQILRATEWVQRHHELVLRRLADMRLAFKDELVAAREHVAAFQRAITASQRKLDAYLEALNRAEPELVWWACVARPGLEATWR